MCSDPFPFASAEIGQEHSQSARYWFLGGAMRHSANARLEPQFEPSHPPVRLAEQGHGSSLSSRLTWRSAFLFPIRTPEGRRDVWIGGLLILTLWPIGWILNLGNRLNVVSRFYRGDVPVFTGFRP